MESLLCAMVADGMTGRRHCSNCDLVAQGVANLGSALFGGLPATGAIARTATNIRAGAFSPVAGMLHAVFLLQLLELRGPFFFGVASRLSEVLDRIGKPPRVFILDMNRVPLIDATGMGAIKELLKRCERDHTQVVLCAMQPQVRKTLDEMGMLAGGKLMVCNSLEEALQTAGVNPAG